MIMFPLFAFRPHNALCLRICLIQSLKVKQVRISTTVRHLAYLFKYYATILFFSSGWDQEIRDDVIEECNKYGGVLHIFVDKVAPQGNVYVKCPTVSTAVSAVNALHGRWFAGKVITGNFFHSLCYFLTPNLKLLFPSSFSCLCSIGKLSQSLC